MGGARRKKEKEPMTEEKTETLLQKHDKKSFFKSSLLGFFIGLAIIVPGVSGSTVAIILKLYDKFLYAVGNLFKRFKACFLFLLPVAIGAVIGFLLGFFAVQQLLELIPFAVICLFAGLMVGSFPAVKDELNGVKMNAKRITLMVVGACIPVAVAVVSAVSTLQGGVAANILEADLVWQIVLPLIVGFVLALTQLVPGLSASAILMLIGWYAVLMQNLQFSLDTLQNVDLIVVVVSLAVGFVAGFLILSKLISTAFDKARDTSYSLIVGLALGSLLTMFFNAEIIKVYADWAVGGINWLHLALGILLLAVGVVGAYLLVRVQRKHDKK
jgi:putative membrane protein